MNKIVKVLMALVMASSVNMNAGGGDAAAGLAGGLVGGMLIGGAMAPREKTVIVQAPAPAPQVQQNTAELDRARAETIRAEGRADKAERRAEELEKKVDTLTSKIDSLVSGMEKKQKETKEETVTKEESSWWPFSKTK